VVPLRGWTRVSGKVESPRSRIRGGDGSGGVEIYSAAQFLTLGLGLSVATESGCVESGVPGHAPL